MRLDQLTISVCVLTVWNRPYLLRKDKDGTEVSLARGDARYWSGGEMRRCFSQSAGSLENRGKTDGWDMDSDAQAWSPIRKSNFI